MGIKISQRKDSMGAQSKGFTKCPKLKGWLFCDFHIHTNFSDGVLLVKNAIKEISKSTGGYYVYFAQKIV